MVCRRIAHNLSKGVHQVLLTDTVNLNHAGTGPKVIGEDCWGKVWTSVGGEVRVAEDQMWMFTDGAGNVLPHGSPQWTKTKPSTNLDLGVIQYGKSANEYVVWKLLARPSAATKRVEEKGVASGN